ncbi:Na+/H+ antiporter subunit E [Mesorhizobium sp. M7A.F.Ca.US.001.04.1.1]|uniref:Na+/H+ antiporter subunit E n=1 Tax=unclassified Mesorhizobium TaxID=325217 RepID=UPI000FC9E660|nr:MULTISPECIES: Na+/H+ antiporter subunit E [unclassified Mesorhizobium]RUY26568.1 Na+/H+ antiporter subunit E [Mesorhizobium sp. M7A.F.Ca.US.001.04.2.1]RUY42196.1 Na+/H+ antiporter subunit E [Mesorhizobium sp. M7A.F.Ca.US.001.04.1.1]
MIALLPYPLLTASLLAMWILLNGLSIGQVFLGGVIALAASLAMAALQPAKPKIRRWDLIPQLVLVVLADIVRSNIAVAEIILQGGRHTRTSGFVMIPLELRDRTGLAVLACIITSTPGTAWVEYHAGSGRLRIHVLDLIDQQAWIDLIKQRYERRLMEIFE